jgi:hypothetical protein
MAHGVATDKTLSKGHLDLGPTAADPIIAAKNCVGLMKVGWPGQTPPVHTAMHFYGTTVPDDTDYPDSIAPISINYRRLAKIKSPTRRGGDVEDFAVQKRYDPGSYKLVVK